MTTGDTVSTGCSNDRLSYERLPKVLPLACAIGDDFPLVLRVKRDLSGYTIAAAVKNAMTGATVCSFAISQEPVIVSGVNCTRLTLTLTDSQTATLSPTVAYRWSLVWTDLDGNTRTPMCGSFRGVRR